MKLFDCRPTLAEANHQYSTGCPSPRPQRLGQTDAGRPGLPRSLEVFYS